MNAVSFLEKLNKFESQLTAGKGKYKNIRDFILTIQNIDSKEQFEEYREKVFPKLVPFLSLLIDNAKQRAEKDPDFDDDDTDLILMKMLAMSQLPECIEAIAEMVHAGHKEDNYFWTTVLNYFIQTKELADIIVNKLDGRLPNGFLGICYLDMLNTVCRKDATFGSHPFSCPEGVARLGHYLSDDQPEHYSYAISATAALPFLAESAWKKLLPIAVSHPDKSVQIEALWAGTKLGDKDYQTKLIDFARDYRYANRCLRYLRELGMENLIPAECQTEEFTILTEMASWLSHPNEFGDYPTELSIVESRTLYWPPTKDERKLSIVRYRYEKWKEDESGEIGVGLVGSVTFCLFGLNDLNERTPEEIFAIHCDWEMELDEYEKPEVGMAILQKHNPGFGSSGK